MNSQAAVKRHACDRCRDQKLRCPRNEQPNGACDRCIRTGAFCVTGTPRPAGRRRTSTARSSCLYEQHQARKPEQRANGITSPLEPQSSYVSPTAMAPGNENGPLPDFDSDIDSILNRCFVENNPAPTSEKSASGTSSTFQPAWPTALFDASAMPGLDLSGLGERPQGSAEGAYEHFGDVETTGSKVEGACIHKQEGNNDPMTPLLNVTERISRLLSEFRNGVWDPGFMGIALLDGNDADSSGPVQLNPLENTLALTIKFALLLQVMSPIEGLTAPPPWSSKPLSTTLTILSAYLQLVQLLDGVLGRIGQGAQGVAEDSPSSLFQSKPARESARTHHVVMVIQVFGHQLQLIEKLLGLPADYRVWDSSNGFHGIFVQQSSSTLIEAVLAQSQDSVQSLKQTMERLHARLRG